MRIAFGAGKTVGKVSAVVTASPSATAERARSDGDQYAGSGSQMCRPLPSIIWRPARIARARSCRACASSVTPAIEDPLCCQGCRQGCGHQGECTHGAQEFSAFRRFGRRHECDEQPWRQALRQGRHVLVRPRQPNHMSRLFRSAAPPADSPTPSLPRSADSTYLRIETSICLSDIPFRVQIATGDA